MIPYNFIFNKYNESEVICCVQLVLKLKLKFEKFPILEKIYNLDSYVPLFEFKIKKTCWICFICKCYDAKKMDILKYLNQKIYYLYKIQEIKCFGTLVKYYFSGDI